MFLWLVLSRLYNFFEKTNICSKFYKIINIILVKKKKSIEYCFILLKKKRKKRKLISNDEFYLFLRMKSFNCILKYPPLCDVFISIISWVFYLCFKTERTIVNLGKLNIKYYMNLNKWQFILLTFFGVIML